MTLQATTTRNGLGALLAALTLCFAACSESGLTNANPGSIAGKGKKDEASKTGESNDDESAPADTPTQISGAFLVCGKDTGERDPTLAAVGDQEGCAVIESATRQRMACEAHDQVKATYADGRQEDVASSPGPATSFWHFRFVTPPGSALQSVTVRSTCGGGVGAVPSLTVRYVPPVRLDGTADLSATIPDAAIPNRMPASVGETPASDETVVDSTLQGASPDLTGPAASSVGYVIFVTSRLFSGNLGGRTGADRKCRDAAAAAGLPTTFRALISTPDRGANRSFWNDRAIENMKGDVVSSASEIWSGSIQNSVKYDEYGEPVSGFVWTATDAYGRYEVIPTSQTFAYASCNGWSVGDGWTGGGLGDPNAIDATWIDTTGGYACNMQAHLYCISQ